MEGRCHCGKLSLRLETQQSPEELAARACGCGFCRPRHIRWTSDPSGHVTIEYSDEEVLTRYRFGTETAEFLLCGRCGFLMAALGGGSDDPHAVINIDGLDHADRFGAAKTTDFGGEDTATRLARRRRTWTPATVRARES